MGEFGNSVRSLLDRVYFGSGVVAALFSALYLKSREEAIRQRLEGDKLRSVEVVVANNNLPKGTQVGRGAFSAPQDQINT